MKNVIYACPMHPEVSSPKPGTCSICGMELKKIDSPPENKESKNEINPTSYKPLVVIISLILLATLSIAVSDVILGRFSIEKSMSNFMAGFFLVFAGFKLLDLKGFATAYQTYDLIASRIPVYGYVFPFIELTFGILYLNAMISWQITFLTFTVMFLSGLGVLNALSKKRRFQCACLGTIIKVPLTSVTLVEDFGMATLALLSLLA